MIPIWSKSTSLISLWSFTQIYIMTIHDLCIYPRVQLANRILKPNEPRNLGPWGPPTGIRSLAGSWNLSRFKWTFGPTEIPRPTCHLAPQRGSRWEPRMWTEDPYEGRAKEPTCDKRQPGQLGQLKVRKILTYLYPARSDYLISLISSYLI